MSDPHRGAYTPPTDAPLSFDARQPVRGSRPLPMTLIISAVVLLTLLVAVVMIYRGGVRGPNEPPRTVGSQVGELKTAPPAGSQPSDPAAGLQIYKNEESAPSPTYAAQPETPLPRPAAPIDARPLETAALPAGQAKPAQVATAVPPKPVAAKPAPTIEALATAAIAPRPVAAKPVVVATATTTAPKPAASAGGAAMVQIGALSSPALADKAWSDAARLAPGLAAGKGKKVEAIDKNGTTLYRTSVTGFASRESAKAFCDAISAAGKSCFVK